MTPSDQIHGWMCLGFEVEEKFTGVLPIARRYIDWVFLPLQADLLSLWFLASVIPRPWRRSQYFYLKRRLTFNGLTRLYIPEHKTHNSNVILQSTLNSSSSFRIHWTGDHIDLLLNCCWPSPVQWLLLQSPTGLINIFFFRLLFGIVFSYLPCVLRARLILRFMISTT
jgi:hypothetical protein